MVTTAPGHSARSFALALSDAIRRCQRERGGKDLATFFDGIEGTEVAESTISRWISEPRRFSAIYLPILVEIDAPFRAQVMEFLFARMVTPEALMERIGESARREVSAAAQDIVFEELPSGWVARKNR